MRLVCPNCDATYEVPDSVIPAEGRDVQCSNCGTSWFFDPRAPLEPDPPVPTEPEPQPVVEPAPPTPAEPEPPAVAEPSLRTPSEPEPQAQIEPEPQTENEPEPQPAVEPARQTTVEPEAASGPKSDQTPEPDQQPASGGGPDDFRFSDKQDDDFEDEGDSAPEPVPTRTSALQKRSLDAQVAEVLRQEAAREAKARAEDEGLEYQDDLPLENASEAAEDETSGEKVATPSGSRRDLLPDIDEINSTLRATSDRKTVAVETAEQTAAIQSKRRGFRTGFGLSLLVLGTMAAMYSYATPLAETVPGLEGTLSSYVEWVNGGRLWLQNAMETLADGIEA